ncbi:WPP domain-associated protein-like [Raphanus sativus]|uniref:WPP domain-associated protein-like n=1 Tax=Raphanus sativus TaxID=3726 RepID=A0A6J0NCT4_RAPSA|nr:WPP domain-associated protein-like [Raphanus sativus]
MDSEVVIGGSGSSESHDHDKSVLIDSVIKENPDVDFLVDDMNNNRLTVSSFVSDSVTSGMVNEVESVACKDEQRLLVQEDEKSLVLDKAKEITGLRRELELISELLSGHEKGDVKDHEGADLLQRSKVSGKHIGSVTSKPENLEYLRRLSREELINHFQAEMSRLKREHECTMQEMTEEYFSIKRRCLRLEECPSLSSLNKDKDFDVLRKKIPDVISKLDKVVLEEGKNSADSKRLLDSLLLENSQLKDSLSDVEDLHVEASIYEDVYGSVVGEFVNQIHCAKEEARREEASASKVALEDYCVESYMAEEYCAVIYKEALKEAGEKIGELNMSVSERERALRWEIAEKEILKEKIHSLECLVKEKENDLGTVKEKLEIVFQQVNNLQFQLDLQEVVIQDRNKELRVALEKKEGYVMEVSELKQKLELARKDMKITENERVKSELKLSTAQAEQKLLQDQIVSTVMSLAKCSQDVECLVAEKTKKINSRLRSMQSQLNDLVDEVDELKVRESMYKQQMEKKTCDLQKAETEVDLLGDEIDSLLDLLQKIYIALDHYSPILKHYPGIIEILKLVQRELRRDSKRLSVF